MGIGRIQIKTQGRPPQGSNSRYFAGSCPQLSQQEDAGLQGHSWLNSKLKISIGEMRSCLKKKVMKHTYKANTDASNCYLSPRQETQIHLSPQAKVACDPSPLSCISRGAVLPPSYLVSSSNSCPAPHDFTSWLFII